MTYYPHLNGSVADAAHAMAIDLSERRTKRGVESASRASLELATVQDWASSGDYASAGVVARAYESLERMRRIEDAAIARVHIASWAKSAAAVTR